MISAAELYVSSGNAGDLLAGGAISSRVSPRSSRGSYVRQKLVLTHRVRISHNKIEDSKEEHLEQAVEALDRLAAKTVNWILGQ